MNANRKHISILFLITIFCFICTIAFATSTQYTITGTYTTVYTNSSNTAGSVTIEVITVNPNQHYDIRYLNSSGTCIYEQYGAIGDNGMGETKTFSYASNVKKIQLRVAGKNIIGDLFEIKRGAIQITYN